MGMGVGMGMGWGGRGSNLLSVSESMQGAAICFKTDAGRSSLHPSRCKSTLTAKKATLKIQISTPSIQRCPPFRAKR